MALGKKTIKKTVITTTTYFLSEKDMLQLVCQNFSLDPAAIKVGTLREVEICHVEKENSEVVCDQ